MEKSKKQTTPPAPSNPESKFAPPGPTSSGKSSSKKGEEKKKKSPAKSPKAKEKSKKKKKSEKKRKKKGLSNTEKQILISAFRNQYHSVTSLRETTDFPQGRPPTTKHLKRLLRGLSKRRYLKYDRKANLIQALARGRKYVLSLLDGWMEVGEFRNGLEIKEQDNTRWVGPLCARLDGAFLKSATRGEGRWKYLKFYGSYHFLENQRPVPDLELITNRSQGKTEEKEESEGHNISPDAVFFFRHQGRGIALLTFFVRQLPSPFLVDFSNSHLQNLLQTLHPRQFSKTTREKWEKLCSLKISDFAAMVITLEESRKEDLKTNLQGPFSLPVYLGYMGDLTSPIQIWEKVWHYVNDQRTAALGDHKGESGSSTNLETS